MSITIEIFYSELPAGNYSYIYISKIIPVDRSSFLENRDWTVFSLSENEFDMELWLTLLMDNLRQAFFPTEDPAESLIILVTAPLDEFSFCLVSEADVILAVSHFKIQAKEEEGIPKASPVIAPNGVFPLAWKKVQVIALRLTPAPSLTSDFRPIALLCFLSKVLEK